MQTETITLENSTAHCILMSRYFQKNILWQRISQKYLACNKLIFSEDVCEKSKPSEGEIYIQLREAFRDVVFPYIFNYIHKPTTLHWSDTRGKMEVQ